MPRRCSICAHEHAKSINGMLIKGMTHREIAATVPGISRSSLARHAKNHVPKELTRAQHARVKINAKNLLQDLERLAAMADIALEAAIKQGGAYGDFGDVAPLIKENARVIELQIRVAREFQREDEERERRELEERYSPTLDAEHSVIHEIAGEPLPPLP
jgi:hypothetical protein